MYYTTKLFLTQTYLDTNKVNSYTFNSISSNGLEDNYDEAVNSGLVICPNFEKKDDFKDVLADLYQKYPAKTFLFLGDINNYSIQLQEGLLKLIEEPPHNLQIIIYSHGLSNVLPTIKSRSQVISLPSKVIASCLDEKLANNIKEKLPKPLEFVKEFININKIVTAKVDLKVVERDELSMWLWQVLFCLKQIYKANEGSRIIATRISKVVEALNLNEANVQKKFVFESLFC